MERIFNQGKKGELRISNREYQGATYIDVRYFHEGFPTKRGITIPIINEIEAIAQAILEAGKAVREARANQASAPTATDAGTPSTHGILDQEMF